MSLSIRFCLSVFWLIGLLWLLEPTPAFAAAIPEQEPNNNAQEAQSLSAIGLDNPVTAAINTPGDEDWYKVDVVTGRTYVIEVYNLDVGLGRATGGNCGINLTYTGLGIIVLDSTATQVARQCAPVAAGNMQNSLAFTANATGLFYIRILPNSTAGNVFGAYALRILPKYDETGAAWDPDTFEPNNYAATSYEIRPGLANALTSTIEARNVAYTTAFVDVDVYRIQATQGRTYVIELFNVDMALTSDSGNSCQPNLSYRGLAMELYRPNVTFLYKECDPRGIGNVHNFLQFTAEESGPYYVRIYPNANTGRMFGTYHLRVLPKYDEPDAAWDAVTFEPNNQRANAYAMPIGRLNAISSTIEARPAGYASNFTDVDWYHFQGEADRPYVVELFNVASSLGTEGGGNCAVNLSLRGVALFVYSPVRNNPIAGQCEPAGHGNVHSIASFTADASGKFSIVVYANSSNVSGAYQLRVLPATDDPAASWDIGMEPNNHLSTAYPLVVDPCGVTTAVDRRRPSFLTNDADFDWFVFNATQNEQYKVALSAIEATLQTKGLYLHLHDRVGTQLQRKLGTQGVEVTFTAGYTGPYYALVYPEGQATGVPSNASGAYRITVNQTLNPGCGGTPPPPAAVEGAISTAPTVDGRLTIVLPRGGNRTLTIKIRTQCTIAQNVQMFVGNKTFAMTAVSDALYQATINVPGDLPTTGSLEINAHYDCNGQLHLIAIAPTIEFHDPSGQITDAATGQPIPNAVVTLYRVPNALPDLPGQPRQCRTVDTRGGADWSQLPAAELSSGVAIDPLADSLNDIQQISPQANPQMTGSEGRYAWDVVEGCWFVVVEAAGYARTISPLVGVPPTVTDLHLQLKKAASALYLPLVRR